MPKYYRYIFALSFVIAVTRSLVGNANTCCISCIAQVHPTVCRGRASNSCTNVPDCLWESGRGCYSWMKDFCDKRIPEVQANQFKGAPCQTREAEWVYKRSSSTSSGRDERPHSTAGLSGCSKFYMIYSGHGSVANFYPTFLNEILAANPAVTDLVIEDTSCQGMANPKQVQDSLASFRPPPGVSYRVWGNQLNSGDHHQSWLGFDMTSEGIKGKLWDCDFRNSCDVDAEHSVSQRTIGSSEPPSMLCLYNGNPTRMSCCRDSRGSNRWSQYCPGPERGPRSLAAFMESNRTHRSESVEDPVQWLARNRTIRQESAPIAGIPAVVSPETRRYLVEDPLQWLGRSGGGFD